ncbi:cyclase family protein [Actinopolyspora xinjiangensis]|nr:cyclase family protein [Actinopolyspora xinjiangensis]
MNWGAGLAASAGLARSARPESGGGGRPRFDPSDMRLVSLSHVNDPETTNVYPGDPEFTLSTVATLEEDGFYLQYVREGEHTGTHFGAPCHFNAGEPSSDELHPEDLMLPAVKLDIRDRAERDPDYAVTVEDLWWFEREHGPIPEGAAVVLWTGWQEKWGTPDFHNFDEQGRMHHPGFAPEAVSWLLETGRLGYRGALGTDTFSPDVGIDDRYRVSLMLYRRHRISLEVLANLESLPVTGGWVLAGGPLHRNGSGATATVFGMVPRH